MTDLDDVVKEGRSTRMFLRDKPVPRELLDEALALAMRHPLSRWTFSCST